MNSALEIFSDLLERVNYNFPDFPLYVRKGRLLYFDKYVAPIHWHSDLEFIEVLDGSMDSEIAFAGNVCRSICCNLFSKYIEQTTNNYIIGYRIQKNCEMLKETKRSISEIAIACGFQSVSYFSYTFRRKMGYGPQH